jgi:hypothetical protein
MMLLRKFLWNVFCGSLLCGLIGFSASLYAVNALNAKVRETQMLRVAPQDESPVGSVQVEVDEVVFVLGTSVDGYWVQVLKDNGKSGWVPINLIDIYRVDRLDYDDFYYAMMRERRVTSRWHLGGAVSYGPVPYGLGGEAVLHLNLFRKGIFQLNVDQIELGAGFRYHLGADPTPALKPDGSLFNKASEAFYEIPVYLLWMFRLGYRGDWMLGPRLGFAVVKDPFFRFDYSIPAVTGFELRHYPRDMLGLSWNVWVHMRSVVYYSTSFGLNIRF